MRETVPEGFVEPSDAGLSGPVWTAIASVIFAACLVTPFQEVWRSGIDEYVPFFAGYDYYDAEDPDVSAEQWRWIMEHDLFFVAWLVPRNSRAILNSPGTLFDTELCHPAKNTLAHGEPMLTLGLIGVPIYWMTRDPIVTYNLVLVVVMFGTALAMYFCVREWSGMAAAGVAAGILYAFQAAKIYNVVHPYVDDTVYTLLALFFVRRYFAHGRLADAVWTGLFCALQIAGSFYPFLAAVLIALPVLVWLLWQYGVSNLRPAGLVAALGLIAVGVYIVFIPFLSAIGAEPSSSGKFRYFLAMSWFVEGGRFYHEWMFYGLALAGLVLGRRRTLRGIDGDPRWALLAGALLIVVVMWRGKTGMHPTPLYTFLSGFVPGLAQVRAPGAVVVGVHVVLSILGGLGCAALIRLVSPRYQALAGSIVIAVVYLSFVRMALLGLEPPVVYEPVKIRPSAASIAFFQTLDQMGNRGALAEIPLQAQEQGERISLAAYHGRRTSFCSGSFHPEARDEVDGLLKALPDEAAVARLHALGFTTVVVHHTEGTDPKWYWVRTLSHRFEAALRRPNPVLRKLHATEDLTAFEIVPRAGWGDGAGFRPAGTTVAGASALRVPGAAG